MSDAAQKSDQNASQSKAKAKKDSKKVDVQSNKWKSLLYFFIFLSLVSFIYLVHNLYLVSKLNDNVNQMEISASRIVNNVNEATFAQGFDDSASAYTSLATDVEQYEQALAQAQAHPLGNSDALNEMMNVWQSSKQDISFILENQSNVDRLQDQYISSVKPAIQEIQENYRLATQQAINTQIPVEQIGSMEQQLIRSERMQGTFNELTLSTGASPNNFVDLAQAFSDELAQEQAQWGEDVPALSTIRDTFDRVIAPLVQEYSDITNLPAIESRNKARKLSNLASNTHASLENVNTNPLSRPEIILALAGFLLSLLGTVFASSRLSRERSDVAQKLVEKETLRQRQEMEYESERARKIQEENERNQMAILRLLDELGDLAEGDLTVNATVSEDFTGAIADSVNFAIDQLRQLVLAINTTAVRVAQSSEQTQMTAMELAEASENQAQEIAGVSAAINEMVVSIDQVSMNASESASVAERSVDIAHNGAEVVQRSIEGMNTIREQIQETSKRIKRLGESSQEIGDIIGLINDIADQTNVLALNAAIQASMAGEAGRGFAVVADEVQRLAERSANATKQIETLVKTIQADTNEAVMSMESTTTEVVRGARLAKDAGEALKEVQSVSNTLADLIQNISNAAQQQASSAGHISKTMNIIQDITSQTSSGTMATARSVGQLNEMAAALQESVSDFKLDDGDEILLEEL